MSDHYIEQCRECGTTIGQCRCPAHNKTVRLSVCASCRTKRDAVVSTLALDSVIAERMRQNAKWGVQNHDPFVYLAILAEEMGETAQAALQARFEGGGLLARQHVRKEAVQTAAVALALVECLDRDAWSWGSHAVVSKEPS